MEYGFDIGVSGIAALLGDKLLRVPPYQRSYAWDTDNVNAFWKDLEGALSSKQSYFLGSVVLSSEGEDQLIVDGQQRVATTALLLCAIRDYFAEQGDTETAQVIQNEHLGRRRLSRSGLMPRLRLGQDDDYFQSILLRSSTVPADTEGERRLQTALETLSQLLSEDLHNRPDAAVRCDEWVDFLRRDALVIRVAVAGNADAFQIFETLNDRGVTLATTDLLRNYLLSRLPVDENLSATQQWNEALDSVTAVGDDQSSVAFVQHYWSGREGPTPQRELYRAIRDRISTADETRTFLSEITSGSRAYSALLDTSHEIWAEFGDSAAGLGLVLSSLKLARVRPLVLALMGLDQSTARDEMFEALARWLPRGLISGTIGGSVAENAFARAALNVRNNEIRDAKQLRVVLTALIPTETQFDQSFANYRLKRPQLGSYILSAVEARNASPVRGGYVNALDSRVVPVFTPGMLQQLATGPQASRRVDAFKDSFANFVLVEAASSQALRGAMGETRFATLKDLTGTELPREFSAPVAVEWLEARLRRLGEGARKTWHEA